MKYGSLVFILFLFCFDVSARSDSPRALSDTDHIPLERISRHDDIKKEQLLCDKLDGKQDWKLHDGNNEAVNNLLTASLINKPNEFRQWIETNDAQMPVNNDKVRFLKYVAEMLSGFRADVRARKIQLTDLPDLITAFEKMLKAKAEGASVIALLSKQSYAIADINAKVFTKGELDEDSANAIVYLKFTGLHPNKILTTISPFAKQSFADSLIVVACKADPVQFYSYAQNDRSIVGRLIHASKDPMVMKVAELSRTENALFYFPFLDDLLSGRQSIDSIKQFVGDGVTGYDSIGYYKLLTKTATAYARRMAAPLKDTAIAYYGDNGLWKTLYNKAKEHFITPINVLHEAPVPVRMRAIQPLSATDLYYMLVQGENDIYTSSYKHSFTRLMELMGPKPHGDSLLLAVNFDHFRKFIKMAANYNKLDTFLKTMPAKLSETLMKAFVANLDNNNLEDAVDVADSYSSIEDKKLQQSMLENVIANERNAIANNNERGKVIYGLLKTIFLSADQKNNIDLTAELGIPSIYEVPDKYMRDEKGRIVEQVFFYGDADGKAFYPPFRNSFSSKDWKVTDKKEWMEAVSLKGNITVFANKPLESDDNLDDSAQVHLSKYIYDLDMVPSVVVHRGHSYWLPRTMSRMPGNAKIVIIGSCGGYQNLNEILDINHDAHIVSTKEIGTGDINRPILSYINDVFMNEKDLAWRKMWQDLSKRFSTDTNKALRESWDDYIPPYKNLGAIFLKAYDIRMQKGSNVQ